MQGQWPVLGVDPDSAERLRGRARSLELAVQTVAAVDWLCSLALFVAPFVGHLLLGAGPIGAARLFLLLAIGTLLFIALQRPLRFAALWALGARSGG